MRFQKYNSLGEMTTVTVEFALTILASLAGEVDSAFCAEDGGVKINLTKLQINPSVTTQGRDSSPKWAPSIDFC